MASSYISCTQFKTKLKSFFRPHFSAHCKTTKCHQLSKTLINILFRTKMLTKHFQPLCYKNKYKKLNILSGNNGRIEYIITAGDDNGDFEIVQNGTILTKHEVDRETKSSYNLVVTAKDCAREPETRLSSTVQVIIIVSIRHIHTYIFSTST